MADCSNVPDLKTLPLNDLHIALGARMLAFAGYAMPAHYRAGVVDEHVFTRKSAGLCDLSHMEQFLLAGDGAALWLETLAPGEFQALQPGRMRYSLLLNAQGGILGDLMVTNAGDHFHLVMNGAGKPGNLDHMRARLPAHLTLTRLDETAFLAVLGPQAVAVLQRLGLTPLEGRFTDIVDLKPRAAGFYRWNAVTLRISRAGHLGEDGFEIAVPQDQVLSFATALLADEAVQPIGLGARDSLRLEAGLPLCGQDLTDAIEPIEAGLAFAISKRRKVEGGFPGAARVLQILLDGPQRKRIGLLMDGGLPAQAGAKLFHGEQEVGVLTSAGYGPSVGAFIAMGYVRADLSGDGVELDVDVKGKRLRAMVVPMPFQRKHTP